MDNVIELPATKHACDTLAGPDRGGCSVIVDGRAIPNMHMYDNGDTIDFILDERLAFEFPREWAYLAASFAANAMAIGAGYAFSGADEKRKAFAPKCGPLFSPEGSDDSA